MKNIAIQDLSFSEIRIIEKSFNLNNQLYDLILKKSGEIFSIIIKDTQGKIHFHEQEISEQLGIQDPNLDQLMDFISTLYTMGLNLQRTRDFQLKLLVDGCPALFNQKNYAVLEYHI